MDTLFFCNLAQLLKMNNKTIIMKIGIYVLMIIGLMTCKSPKFEKNPPFQITGATYNNWVGGQPGISGMKIIIGYTANQNVVFKSIFFFSKEMKVEHYKNEGNNYIIGRLDTSTRGDRDRILDKDPKKEMQNKLPKKKLPFKLKENEAIIVYMDGKTKKYVKVENIKQTNTDFYP